MVMGLLQLVRSDSKFLKRFVSAIDIISEALPKQMIGIKDCHSINIYCSRYFLEEVLAIDASKIIGKLTIENDAGRFSPVDQIIAEDQGIINRRKPQAFLKLNNFNDGIRPRIIIKSPIINPATDNVVGLIYQGIDWSLINFNQQLIKAHQLFKPQGKELANLPKLTKREKQIVFFFLAKLSSQEIADILYTIENKHISKSTIDSIFIDRLYIKFEVTNRQALYDKLLALGYDNLIPQDLLISTTIPLNEPLVY
jgi:DNA-binding CsgD family transcriptional regulator